MMKIVNHIDLLNIILILFSFVLAIFLPFELFLFSYAFLGPLHYFTEINWLHHKDYFVGHHKKWMSVFVAFVVIGLMLFFLKFYIGVNLSKSIFLSSRTLLLSALLFSVFLISFNKKVNLFLALFVSYFLAILLRIYLPTAFYVIGVFLPTLIHVYLFTILFMIYGILKKHSSFGVYAIIFLIFIPFLIFLLPIELIQPFISNQSLEIYSNSNFEKINMMLSKIFKENNFSLTSTSGLKFQIFIAFAYTYHYLNWFSKTNIIGWKKHLNKSKTFLILALCLVSSSIYIYDYQIGFTVLLFWSMLHVYLELPLNVVSLQEILKTIKAKL